MFSQLPTGFLNTMLNPIVGNNPQEIIKTIDKINAKMLQIQEAIFNIEKKYGGAITVNKDSASIIRFVVVINGQVIEIHLVISMTGESTITAKKYFKNTIEGFGAAICSPTYNAEPDEVEHLMDFLIDKGTKGLEHVGLIMINKTEMIRVL